jgi:hypothetical protein
VNTHITLVFDHPPCNGVRVDIHLPLPDPPVEDAEAMAERMRPACPVCKRSMQYVGFYFGGDDEPGRLTSLLDQPSIPRAVPRSILKPRRSQRSMSKLTHVHWLFKEEAVHAGQHLCDVPRAAHSAAHSIVLRPVIRQKRGGRLRECVRCSAIGKALGIPPPEDRS